MHAILSEAHFHSEEAAFAHVEARLWPNGPVCPHCGATKEHVGKLEGKTARVGLRKCYACRQQFTVKVGTVMESSHVPMRYWLQTIYLMNASKKGIATRQLQRMFNCSMKTAWFLSHRVREAMKDLHIDDAEPMGGAGKIVEADETYIGGKEKWKHKSKRTKGNIGGKGKEVVFALVERGGKVRAMHVANVTAKNLRPILKAAVHPETAFMSDDAGHYRLLGPDFARHEAVNHGADEYVRGDAHINTAENYFSILKRGLTGVYHSVSKKHLHRYLSEFDHRYTHRVANGVDDKERADLALKGIKGKRLTYQRTRHGNALQQAVE